MEGEIQEHHFCRKVESIDDCIRKRGLIADNCS